MNSTNATLINSLHEAIAAKNETQILKLLKDTNLQQDDIKLSDDSIPRGIIALNNEKVTERFLEVAAEWSKSEENRHILENKEIVEFFMKYLQHSKEQTVLNVVRLLGNICYENENAQLIVGTKGLSILIDLLKNHQKHADKTLTVKTSGFLVNLLSLNENLQKEALKLDLIPVIKDLLSTYVEAFEAHETLFMFLLNILNSVLLYTDELSIPFPDDLCLLVIQIFRLARTRLEISVVCFEILYDQIENDDVKILLAKNGICELIIELIIKHQKEANDEEKRSFMKQACDAIVVILTEDNCMNLLYDNGKGRVYQDMIDWLEYEDPDLLSTAVLALGNFARKDSNCIKMVQEGIAKKLINLLGAYNRTVSDIKVQHALLSTLKNLAILKVNKAKILEDGLIEVIYPLTESDQYVIVFKLLGLFRIATEGQEASALDLVTRKDFLVRLVHWCYNSDHPGVRSEVPRLLAWLVRHAHSTQPYAEVIATSDAVKCVVEMISAPHALMQNEALQAMDCLCAVCCDHAQRDANVNNKHEAAKGGQRRNAEESDGSSRSELCDKLIQAEIGKHLESIVKKYGSKMNGEVLGNLLNLLEKLCSIPKMLEHLKCHSLQEVCSQFTQNPDVAGVVRERIDSLVRTLNN